MTTRSGKPRRDDITNSYDALLLARAKPLDGRPRNAADSALAARTVREWGAEWLLRRERDGLRSVKDDRVRWEVHVLSFAPWADDPLTSVTRELAREWFSLLGERKSSAAGHRRRQPLAAQTLRNILNLVRRAFADAMDDGLIALNPFAGLRVHRSRAATTRELSTVIAFEEQPKALAAVPYPERWIVEFALGSGMRQGEQWALLLRDLELNSPRPSAVIRFGKGDGPTKGGRVRRIFLFGLALEAARAWLGVLSIYAPQNPLGLVFPRRDGKRRRKSEVFRSFERLSKALGRPVRWHDLRHTCGTSLAAGWWGDRWSVEALRVHFGHSTVKVTEGYVRLAAELAGDAAARMPVQSVFREPDTRPPKQKTRGNAVKENHVDANAAIGDTEPSGRGSQAVRHRFAKPDADLPGSTPQGVEPENEPSTGELVAAEEARVSVVVDRVRGAGDGWIGRFRHEVRTLLRAVEDQTARANENAAFRAEDDARNERDELARKLARAEENAGRDVHRYTLGTNGVSHGPVGVPQLDVVSPALHGESARAPLSLGHVEGPTGHSEKRARTLGGAPLTFAGNDRVRIIRGPLAGLAGVIVCPVGHAPGFYWVAVGGNTTADKVCGADLDLFPRGFADEHRAASPMVAEPAPPEARAAHAATASKDWSGLAVGNYGRITSVADVGHFTRDHINAVGLIESISADGPGEVMFLLRVGNETGWAPRSSLSVAPAPVVVPPEAFGATELGATGPHWSRVLFTVNADEERETSSEPLEHDEDDEPDALLDAALAARNDARRERDAALARLAVAEQNEAAKAAQLREAIGLLNDIDREGARIATWLDAQVKK